MPDRLSVRAAAGRGLLVVLAFAAAGALAGWAWEALWEAPAGVAYEGEWFQDGGGPDAWFAGTGLYVLLAVPVGFVLGAGAGLLPRHEAVTLGSVLVGSVLAGWLMYAVGHALGPPDPTVLAAGRPDFTAVPADLVLAAPGDSRTPYRSTAFLAFPVGALAGLAIVLISGFGHRRHG